MSHESFHNFIIVTNDGVCTWKLFEVWRRAKTSKRLSLGSFPEITCWKTPIQAPLFPSQYSGESSIFSSKSKAFAAYIYCCVLQHSLAISTNKLQPQVKPYQDIFLWKEALVQLLASQFWGKWRDLTKCRMQMRSTKGPLMDFCKDIWKRYDT